MRRLFTERLRVILIEEGHTTQATKGWKASSDPDFDAKAARLRRLIARLEAHRRRRWPQLEDARVRFRAPYAYVEATLPDGYDQPLFRLRWANNRERWGFAIWLASKDGYEQSVPPSGALVGTVEEAMDCACGLNLNDTSAWELPRQRSAPPH